MTTTLGFKVTLSADILLRMSKSFLIRSLGQRKGQFHKLLLCLTHYNSYFTTGQGTNVGFLATPKPDPSKCTFATWEHDHQLDPR